MKWILQLFQLTEYIKDCIINYYKLRIKIFSIANLIERGFYSVKKVIVDSFKFDYGI